MHVQKLPDHHGAMVELDLCFQCQGMWIDPQENQKLSPTAVADLFKLLHTQRAATRHSLSHTVHCPRCTVALTQGFEHAIKNKTPAERSADASAHVDLWSIGLALVSIALQ